MKMQRTKIGKRLTSLLIAVAMFLTMQGIPVQAEIVGQEAKEREMPKNPVHHCTKEDDGSDYTDWSYVYFGSYPQTEVTGSALTTAITGASYDANGDAWVNGIKYRRIKRSDANNRYTDDGYFSWNGDNDYHYFKWERIKWRVLQNNGSTLFVIADKGLDCKDYNETYTSITWENCTLRNWLNSSFYSAAFSSQEQGAIVSRNVVNEDNSYYGTEGGNNTNDKVYLLSIGETINPLYGVCETHSTYSASRQLNPSDYAHARGVRTSTNSDYAGNCWWWLRSPGGYTNYAAYVYYYGYVNGYGSYVSHYDYAVVPALHINLSSDLWSMADEIETPSNTPENKLQCQFSCIIEEGHNKTLPITVFEDSLDKLELLTGNITWKSEDTDIATVNSIGFILPTNVTKYSSENGTYETWKSTGMISVCGVSKGTTTITGTASDGSTVSCKVTVTGTADGEDDSTEGNGGSLVLGEESSGSANSSAAEFFPANWSLKFCVFPVEISKQEKEDGFYTIKGAVGIGRSDWLDNKTKWDKYKKNVDDANKYMGRVDCLNSYRDTWGVKSVTAVTTDKFEVLPKLSVMGYFENTYDKNGNLISKTGKLAADAKWSGSINWQFVTPIGPLYLNLSGSGKLSGILEPKYDYDNKSLKIADGSLKLTPSVTLEGGYGIDKVATIGAQGTLSIPIIIVPASKGEFEAKAAIRVKLVFVIDWTHDLATYKTTLWDTPKKTRMMSGSDVVYLSEGTLSEMDTSFDDYAGDWNPNTGIGKLGASKRSISETIADSITMLQEGILPSSLPMQAQIGGKNVMIFQAYDNTRTTLNSTVLKYSVLENGTWSEPKAVLDDGCSDMYADMKVVNGNLALVWQKEKKIIAGDVETDSEKVLKDIAENSEIYFALFDEETNTFCNTVSVTDNNDYDMMPRIVSDNDEITVSWVRNDESDLMQETGSNTIYTAKWDGAAFGEEVFLSKASGTIDDYVVYQDENGIQSVFTGQANGITAIFDTNGNVIDSLSELMLASEDGKISGLNYAAGKVSFISQGTLYTYDTLSETFVSAQAGESAFGSEVRYCSNGEKTGYIWSVYDDETKMGRILASMKTENGYSEPITVCEKENTMWRYFSPVIDSDGNWNIVANALDTEKNNNALLYVTKKEESRLELAGASVDENDVVDGFTGVDYFVTNTQDTTVNNIEVEVVLGDGSKITKTVPVTLLPGESKAGTAYVDLKDVASEQNVTLSITAENQEDKSGCTVTDQIGKSDISVEAVSSETTDEIEITATLKNESAVNASATLHLYGDENKTAELKKQENISLKANGTAQAKFTVKKKDIVYNENRAAYLTLVAETKDGDYKEDNNTAYVILYQADDPENTECAHQNTEVRNQLATTCGSEGYTGDTYCKDCNAKIETGQVIVATGEHTWNEEEEIKSPTCTEKGEKEYTCTVCGEIKTEEIDATGHQNTEVKNKQEMTCKADGYSGDVYCKDCNAKIESGQVVVATGKHTWNEGEEIKSSTCTEKGEKEYTCTVCGEIKTEEIDATGHQNTEVRNKQEATCKADGYSGDVYCKDCNAKIESGQVVVATGKHTWNEGEEIKSPTCIEKGEKKYTCTVCGETKKEEIEKSAHTYKTTVTKATTAKNGSITEKCTACGEMKNTKVIYSVKSATLKSASYTYNGKAKKPSVILKDSSGKVIDNCNYAVTYKNNKKIGKATVTIKLKGNYTGTVKKNFKILPQRTSISGKITAKVRGFTIRWKKQTKYTNGYQIQYSTDKKFTKKKTVTKTIKNNSITKLSINKLESKKKYYVRIRTYKTVKGKKYYSAWSKIRKVTTKEEIQHFIFYL